MHFEIAIAAVHVQQLHSVVPVQPIYYVHVPKTGGHSVLRALNISFAASSDLHEVYGIQNGTLWEMQRRGWEPNDWPVNHLTFPMRQSLGLVVPNIRTHLVLCTVRDPYERFASIAWQLFGYRHQSYDALISFCESRDMSPWCIPQTSYTHPYSNETICTATIHTSSLTELLPKFLTAHGLRSTIGAKRKFNVAPLPHNNLNLKHASFVEATYTRDCHLLGFMCNRSRMSTSKNLTPIRNDVVMVVGLGKQERILQQIWEQGSQPCVCEQEKFLSLANQFSELHQSSIRINANDIHQSCATVADLLHTLVDWQSWGRRFGYRSICEPLAVAGSVVCGISLAMRQDTLNAARVFASALMTLNSQVSLLGCYDSSEWPFTIDDIIDNFMNLLKGGASFRWANEYTNATPLPMDSSRLSDLLWRLQHALGFMHHWWNALNMNVSTFSQENKARVYSQDHARLDSMPGALLRALL